MQFEQPPHVWNRNFVLLWQGQLVSTIGTVAFNIALGFWVLRATGSSAVMGSVMATAALFQVVGGPIGGALADRWSRKRIIVITDLASGAAIIAGAGLLYAGRLEIWMVFVGAALLGLVAAVFQPAVRASIPDLVPEKELDKGNSAFGIIQQLSGIIGNTLGGALYTWLGAPLLFLINGITFVASSISEAFMRLPTPPRPGEEATRDERGPGEEATRDERGPGETSSREERKPHLAGELKEGWRFVWNNPVLRLQLLNIGTLNLFLTMGGVLYLPYFERSTQFLPTDYGLTMAFVTGGALLGLVLLQFWTIPFKRRFALFAVLSGVFGVSRTLILSIPVLPVIMSFAFASGFAVSIINTIVLSTLQGLTPANMRGKVFGLLGSFTGGLIPLGTATGGILGDLFPITTVVPVTGIIATVGFLPLVLSKRVARAYAGEGRLEHVGHSP